MAARSKITGAGAREPGRIARITIEGFKSVAKETIELGRLNVLIGPNGVGKSAVLEANGVLGAAAEGRVDAGELWRRGVRPSSPALLMTALGKKAGDADQALGDLAGRRGVRGDARPTRGRALADPVALRSGGGDGERQDGVSSRSRGKSEPQAPQPARHWSAAAGPRRR